MGPFSFPDGGAAARRILGNALSLRAAGYDVLIGSGQLPRAGPEVHMYQDIPVFSTGERTAENYPTLIKHVLYFTSGKKTLAWLDSLNPRPVAVILYSGYSPYLLRLLPWCQRNRIPLIFDAVEWYDPSHVPGGALSPYRWNIELAMRHLNIKARNVLAISSFLQRYYLTRGCTVLRVPPTLDTQSIKPRLGSLTGPRITIGYTGTPGRKDLFDSYIEGILRVDPEGKRLRLRVAGLSKEEVMVCPAIRQRGYTIIPTCIEAIGKVPHATALDLIRDADYSVLLRPPLRYAQAGFPTKVVESLALGTPVICNLTSDLGDYIHDCIEGIVCDDWSVESFTVALDRALSISVEEYQRMRVAARSRAEESFDYRRHSGRLAEYIEGLRLQ